MTVLNPSFIQKAVYSRRSAVVCSIASLDNERLEFYEIVTAKQCFGGLCICLVGKRIIIALYRVR